MLPLASSDPGQIAAYELSGVLGRGGQGSVYMGKNAAGAQVAVKVLHAQVVDEEMHRRFLREAEAARRVAPFCTARVLDVGVEDGRPYMVSEYIAGPSLERLVKGEGVRFGSGLERLAVATLTALAAIHRAGVVHRDFKPSNVIMGAEGPVVIDFGIARAHDQTATSSIMGTPAFMAPEQFEGRALTGAADLFSWTSTMVFAATGEQAFRGDTMPSLMHAILTTEPDLSGVPAEIRPLLHACLAKDPAQRPTADGLLAQLTGAPSGPQVVPTQAAPPQGVPTQAAPTQAVRPQAVPPQPQPVAGTLRLPPAPGPQVAPWQPPAKAQRSPADVVHLIASVLALALGGLISLTLLGHAVTRMPVLTIITLGAALLFVPAFSVALWRHSVASAICMAMLVPLALVLLFWATALDSEDDLPELLVAVVPGVLMGVMVCVAALALWRLSAAAGVIGAIGGALVALEALALFAVTLSETLPHSIYHSLPVVSAVARVVLAAWIAVTCVVLVVRAFKGSPPKIAA
ncbi:protein kinase [Nonomuraea sp. NPDC055795]